MKLAKKFCKCIKSVRKTIKVRGKNKSNAAKESAAIGVCVKAVLQTRGRTLKRFKCGKRPVLNTQKKLIKKTK
jgi:hypothetical protein